MGLREAPDALGTGDMTFRKRAWPLPVSDTVF
jgi:hypothetical protein